MRIIIVEDEPEVRSVLRDFVDLYAAERGQECLVESLADPVEALFRISDAPCRYDAILLDVRMPGMRGDDIYQAIDGLDGDLTGRVLFVTGYAHDLIERFRDRPLHLLTKPFTFDAFCRAMDAVLRPSEKG